MGDVARTDRKAGIACLGREKDRPAVRVNGGVVVRCDGRSIVDPAG